MSNIQKLIAFGKKAMEVVVQKQKTMHNNFMQTINQADIQVDSLNSSRKEKIQIQHQQQKFQCLQDLELHQSTAINNKKNSRINMNKNKRVKQIEQQKMKIAQELKKLDQQIDQIKGKGNGNEFYRKRQQVQNDQKAKKNAQNLVKELNKQKKQIQIKKRKQFQKSLQSLQKQQQERKRKLQEQAIRIKQERRLAIIQRMEEEKKRKQQRKLIQAQSNQLLVKLKKEQRLQKQATIAPSQLIQMQKKRKIIDKKNSNFDLVEIQEHNRNYNKKKQQSLKQKKQRAQSLKHNHTPIKYPKNMWIQRLQQQQNQKKIQKQNQEQKRKNQLQKRLKYGQLVKNIFVPKKRENSRDRSSPLRQIRNSQLGQDLKPTTPQQIPNLPRLTSEKSKTQDKKMYKDDTLPQIKRSSNVLKRKQKKQFNQDNQQRQKQRKIRQQQLRKQTNDRLKKLQNRSIDKIVQKQKPPKYENYLGKVKLKKQDGSEWKKIMQNEKMSEQEKYKQLMKKAQKMESKAKQKQDKGLKNQTGQEAVNLYINSIQAKLALLQKF